MCFFQENYEDGILFLIHSQQIKDGINKIFEGLEAHVKLQENLITQYQRLNNVHENEDYSNSNFCTTESKIGNQSCKLHNENSILKDENFVEYNVYECVKTEGTILSDNPSDDVKIEADFAGCVNEDFEFITKLKQDSDGMSDDPSFISTNKHVGKGFTFIEFFLCLVSYDYVE